MLLAFTAVSAKVIKQNHAEESVDQEMQNCLATVYVSEKSYQIEEEIYTEDNSLLGLDERCNAIIKRIDVYTHDKFIV